MKKSTWFLMLAAFAVTTAVFGAEKADARVSQTKTVPQQSVKRTDWTPFQLAFFPGVPAGTRNSNVYGLKLGIPCTGGNGSIKGVEASFLYSGTSYGNPGSMVEGIQGSWFGPSMAEEVSGIQGTMSFAYARSITGFQAAGLAFLAQPSMGCQAGLGSVALKGFDGFQTGAANITAGAFNGFQFGAANIVNGEFNGFQCGAAAVAGDATGFQCNLVNIVTKVSNAFQCGVFNYSRSKGVQLGAINVISGGWLPVMVIFNFAM